MEGKRKSETGFTLIEVLIALLVLSVGLLAMNTMQVMAVRTNTVASSMTTANSLAQGMVDRFRSDPSNVANFAASTTIDLVGWQAQVANALPSGQGTVAVAPIPTNLNRVTVTVSWKLFDPDANPANRNRSVVLTTIM